MGDGDFVRTLAEDGGRGRGGGIDAGSVSEREWDCVRQAAVDAAGFAASEFASAAPDDDDEDDTNEIGAALAVASVPSNKMDDTDANDGEKISSKSSLASRTLKPLKLNR